MAEMHPSMKRLYAAAQQLTPPIRGQSAMARALGQSPQTLKNWETRSTGVSAAGANKAQQELGISSTWVMEAIPPMLIPSATSISLPATTPGYLRVDQLDVVGGMGGAMVNDDHPEIIRSMEYGEAYIRALIGFVPPPGRLKLVSGVGDSMRPLIEPGEPTLMDSGVTTFRGDGIYWIGLGDRDDGHQIKMLQQRGDGLWVVSANPLYPPFPFPENGRIGGQLYIRHRIERFN